ncbi:MAG: DUF6174 domain-containing protein [Chloroflexota bacterium]|nr:DUF6174 domain-containing protein [Chloroflexota bacterium]
MVVEYLVYGGMPTKAQALEKAEEWIASNHEAWWNKREAIIFLDDLRFGGAVAGGKISELSTDAHYSFANHFWCEDSSCAGWELREDSTYPNWVWLPFVGQDASLEVPDSERMFQVVVDPYDGDSYGNQTLVYVSLADIKAIIETYWSRSRVGRPIYLEQQRRLWETKSADSYSFVYSYVEKGRIVTPATMIVVRNREVVAAVLVEDVDEEGEIRTAGFRIEIEPGNNSTTLELDESLFWSLALGWATRKSWIADASFDYEFGYPTTIKIEERSGTESFFYISNYTPLDI